MSTMIVKILGHRFTPVNMNEVALRLLIFSRMGIDCEDLFICSDRTWSQLIALVKHQGLFDWQRILSIVYKTVKIRSDCLLQQLILGNRDDKKIVKIPTCIYSFKRNSNCNY